MIKAPLSRIAENGLNEKPVIYISGNHEFYRRAIDRERAKAVNEAAKHPNIHILQDSKSDIGDVRFLGATLWTDYELYGYGFRDLAMMTASNKMSDHGSPSAIRLASKSYRRFLPKDALAEHFTSGSWLEFILGEP